MKSLSAMFILMLAVTTAYHSRLDAATIKYCASEPTEGHPIATKRDSRQIMSDLIQANRQLSQALKSRADLADETKRKELAPILLPILSRISALLQESASDEPRSNPRAMLLNLQIMSDRAILGDTEALQFLDAKSESSDQRESLAARADRLYVRWMLSSTDATSQKEIQSLIAELAKNNPTSTDVANALQNMASFGAATPELATQMQNFLLETMQTPSVTRMKEKAAHNAKMASVLNKPVSFETRTLDGGMFNIQSLRGKVVMIDFWATWCGPCVAELPRIKTMYTQYHHQGLEIVSVSCDTEVAKLTEFLAKDSAISWTQLFDKDHPGLHALAAEYDVKAIPAMFLIDRKGILRSVNGQEEMEKMIPKLLSEPTD